MPGHRTEGSSIDGLLDARSTPELDLASVAHAEPPVRAPRRRRRPRRRVRALEQLAFELGSEQPLWTFSRLVLRSPHMRRIREYLEVVRRFFPELDACTVRVGLVKKRGIMGWGSLDPDHPGIWVRPRRLDYFTITHEFTHLLQARKLVPHGERACDLWALARSPLLVDTPPGYLKMPRCIRQRARVEPEHGKLLNELARRAVAAREAGDRRYLSRFEHEVASAFGEAPARRRRVSVRRRSGVGGTVRP